MKKIHLIGSLILPFLLSCNDDEQSVSSAELPAPALTFIQTHFPETEITQVIRDKERKSTDYEVWLDNKFDLEFEQDGNWTEIDGHDMRLPDTVIPESILTYVASNYTDQFVVELNKDRNVIETQLSGNLELLFDTNGNFLSADFDD